MTLHDRAEQIGNELSDLALLRPSTDKRERDRRASEAAEIIERHLQEMQQEGWISVEERLPEPSHAYMVCLLGMAVCDAWFSGKGQWEERTKFKKLLSVTHWRELPTPPKGERPA